MKKCALPWVLAALLSIAVMAMAYRFIAGEVQPSDDGRLAIQVTKDEHSMLMQEMRAWLQSSQAIMLAANKQDFAEVGRIAKAAGMSAEADVPGALFRKIPVQMKRLGFDTRQKFDGIAADAVKLKDSRHTLEQLGMAMQNCINCHAAYRFIPQQ